MRCCNSRTAVWLLACLGAIGPLTYAASPPTKPTFHTSIAAAAEAAGADQSLVLVIFGADWCAPCHLLKKNTLASEDFLGRAGSLRVVEIDIDADMKSASAYEVTTVPALVLMTADGKIAARQTGYLDVTQMLAWLEEGRQRVKQGQWEGTAPGTKMREFVAKAAAGKLEEADLKELVTMLGEPDPAERAAAAKILLSQREVAMAPLLEHLSDPYLGVRIGTAELLQKLAPDAVRIDPWQSPKELSDSIALLKKWWAGSGKLPPAAETRKTDPALIGSIKAAVEALRGNDGAKRTEAMSTLVAHGEMSLPEIRDAVRRSDKAGDHRAVSLLEDVRWAILVSDAVEQRVHARTALARGTSQERQAATVRLGRGGKEAIPALAELVKDTDSLVIENAVRALSNIGGKDTIPAMAVLLKTSDPNLRMTAAQALGHTKNAEAMTPLLGAVADPNEVVACTALAGVEEIYGPENAFSSSSTKRAYPAELISTLRSALGDARWRVRATASEVIGKLQVADLKADLKKLLDDADGFVVKNALTALQPISALPEPEQLAAVAKRLPALRGELVRLMAKSSPGNAVPITTELYTNSSSAERLAILGALAHQDRFENEPLDEAWQPFIAAAAKEPDVKLRRAAAVLLGRIPTRAAAKVIDGPLADEDREVRSSAAKVVLWIVAGREPRPSFETTSIDEDEFVPSGIEVRNSVAKTNEPTATPVRRAAWRERMLKHPGDATDPVLAAAIYATGNGTADVPLLARALGNLDATAAQNLAQSPAMSLILPKLSWPQGEPILQALSNSPALFAVAASQSSTAAPPVRAYFTDAARFRAVLERARSDELALALPLLLRRGPGVALLTPASAMKELAATLAHSTSAGCRAAGVYALGYQNAASSLELLTNAVRDANPSVRAASVQSLARLLPERKTLEERVGPVLGDADLHVAQMAALALLEPEIRNASGMQWFLQAFQFEDAHAAMNITSGMEESDRPLTTLETKPPYLDLARQQLKNASGDDGIPFALLLAQHGEFDAIGLLTKKGEAQRSNPREDTSAQAVLTAIALSRDVKYVPTVRAMMDDAKGEWELRAMLRALRGMSGPQARQLRLEINRQMRKTAE